MSPIGGTLHNEKGSWQSRVSHSILKKKQMKFSSEELRTFSPQLHYRHPGRIEQLATFQLFFILNDRVMKNCKYFLRCSCESVADELLQVFNWRHRCFSDRRPKFSPSRRFLGSTLSVQTYESMPQRSSSLFQTIELKDSLECYRHPLDWKGNVPLRFRFSLSLRPTDWILSKLCTKSKYWWRESKS